MKYDNFLERKSHLSTDSGFKAINIPDFLYDFQKYLVDWSLLKGRSAIFADCGLGKTPMQLVWANNVVRKENRPVLILTPLAVAGVGSEVYGAVMNNRKGIGVELKESYYNQAVKNLNAIEFEQKQMKLFE